LNKNNTAGLNVLSLFDGMSAGMIALERANILVSSYYASEIDKHAIKVSQANYPEIIRIGDVTKVSYSDGMLTTENGTFYVGKIDLLIGGSPCQSISNAGMGEGLQGKSKLFYEYLRVLKEVSPTNFLLENVVGKKEAIDTITSLVGVQPIKINSNLVSAQNRNRYYWTDIENVSQPVNLEIYLCNIISEMANGAKIFVKKNSKKPKTNQSKAGCLCSGSSGDTSDMDIRQRNVNSFRQYL
jgi:site-specific DNA-cytosine methylase